MIGGQLYQSKNHFANYSHAETLLEVGVGEPARHPLLERERPRLAVPRRRRMTHQPAQVVEERLRPLSFAEPGVSPASRETPAASLSVVAVSSRIRPPTYHWLWLAANDTWRCFRIVLVRLNGSNKGHRLYLELWQSYGATHTRNGPKGG